MNELQVFSYEGNDIRTVRQGGETWWVTKDVCDVFGESNRNRAMQVLADDEKGYTQMTTPGGLQNFSIINESGLYSLLFAMQPQKARGVNDEYISERIQQLRAFRRWVTREVLPSIRKVGLYVTPDAAKKLLENPDFLIEALTELKTIRTKNVTLTETVYIQNQQIAEMTPKAGYYDIILACKDAVAITTIAKDYGKSGQWLNEYLHALGVQFKQGNIWLLYQKHAEYGYTCTRTLNYLGTDGDQHSKVHTYWTQKGRLFIYELLKLYRCLPLIEQLGCWEADDGQV